MAVVEVMAATGTVSRFGAWGSPRAPYGTGLNADAVSDIIGLGTQVTTTVLDNIPSLQRSQIERLSAKKADLVRKQARARTAADRAAYQIEIDGIDQQIRQYQTAAAAAQGGAPVVIQQQASANMGAIVAGVLGVGVVVAGAVWLARR